MSTIIAPPVEKRLEEIRELCQMQIGFLIKDKYLDIFSAMKYMVSLYDEQSAMVKKLEEALEHISKTDTCNPQMGGPNQRWLTDWRNITKELAGKALAEFRAWREGK